jgi:hypothetical protein
MIYISCYLGCTCSTVVNAGFHTSKTPYDLEIAVAYPWSNGLAHLPVRPSAAFGMSSDQSARLFP